MLLRNNTASADAGCRKEITVKFGQRTGHVAKTGETRQHPFVIDLPAILRLHGVHHSIPVSPARVAAQVGAAAECTLNEKWRVFASRTNHEASSKHIALSYRQVMVDAQLEYLGVKVTAERLPVETRICFPQPAVAREVLVIATVDFQRNGDGAHIQR